MTEFSVLQLSDTHLSDRFGYYASNNGKSALAAAGQNCDYIVHTGDITLDGIRHPKDFEDSSKFFKIIDRPVLCLPGNHDIGDNAKFAKAADENGSALNAERLRRHEDYFGSTWWSFDHGSWRVIGVNAMIIGSNLLQEQEQYEWISSQMETLDGRFIALFSHLPIFVDTPEDGLTLNYWSIDPVGHTRMSTLINHPNLRLVGSGHLHQQRSRKYRQINLEWCPSTAFTTGPSLVPEMGGSRQVGYLVHRFRKNGEVETAMIVPEGLVNHHLEDVVAEVYPGL
ncbi:MAG: metallophosphoesterase [Rhizobiaceae bacterium]|nr:metallophosphoesterase [Rhizobiaceae bacterium]